jgi:hypothetical protein
MLRCAGRREGRQAFTPRNGARRPCCRERRVLLVGGAGSSAGRRATAVRVTGGAGARHDGARPVAGASTAGP